MAARRNTTFADNPRTDWMMNPAPEPGLNGRSLACPRGKVLGGCSSINGMIYMQGQAANCDHWRQLGNVGWSWDDVLPYFLKSEDHNAGASAMDRFGEYGISGHHDCGEGGRQDSERWCGVIRGTLV